MLNAEIHNRQKTRSKRMSKHISQILSIKTLAKINASEYEKPIEQGINRGKQGIHSLLASVAGTQSSKPVQKVTYIKNLEGLIR